MPNFYVYLKIRLDSRPILPFNGFDPKVKQDPNSHFRSSIPLDFWLRPIRRIKPQDFRFRRGRS
jgi:hypothetical protein